ncbi:MAG: DNA-(apurinic or apyrimidinic site) lyase [Solirubrobacterales bacterium]|jgi:endonuclease-8|nr:DNA-(apurinic or apyrimidinic site) lyase [Solirubrobacterales bacterium]
MAEGDTIRRLAHRLNEALGGSEVVARTPGRRPPEGRPVSDLDGATLLGAESRGKHLLIRFEGGLVLHSHLGMRGAWHIYRSGERWRLPASKAWIALAGGSVEAVNFNGSSMRIVREVELGRDLRLARLGPDILDPDRTDAELAGSLRGAEAGTELGDALLNQTLIAGVGNIFKSEGCFGAQADPWRRVDELDDDELEAVVSATRRLMEGAVRTGRSPQRIYRRAGRPCPRCRSKLRSRGQGDDARTTYWCPRCQGAGPRAARRSAARQG